MALKPLLTTLAAGLLLCAAGAALADDPATPDTPLPGDVQVTQPASPSHHTAHKMVTIQETGTVAPRRVHAHAAAHSTAARPGKRGTRPAIGKAGKHRHPTAPHSKRPGPTAKRGAHPAKIDQPKPHPVKPAGKAGNKAAVKPAAKPAINAAGHSHGKQAATKPVAHKPAKAPATKAPAGKHPAKIVSKANKPRAKHPAHGKSKPGKKPVQAMHNNGKKKA